MQPAENQELIGRRAQRRAADYFYVPFGGSLYSSQGMGEGAAGKRKFEKEAIKLRFTIRGNDHVSTPGKGSITSNLHFQGRSPCR